MSSCGPQHKASSTLLVMFQIKVQLRYNNILSEQLWKLIRETKGKIDKDLKKKLNKKIKRAVRRDK